MRRLVVLVLLVVVIAAGVIWWQFSKAAEPEGAQASLLPLLTEEESTGFTRATEPGVIQFPQDLGPHNDFQTEWWYYTGNLETAEGRDFGFQLTFFRRAAVPPPEAEATDGAAESNWRTEQIFLAHFTISDVAEEAFYPAERFARGAAGLAGAEAEPYHVWLENWYARQVAPGEVRLFAETDEVALDLLLTETLPPVLHGNQGLSQKGITPGNASYYYSIIGQQAAGTLRVGAETYTVTGHTWKDHEWSTSVLDPGAVGWDWFSLQFENGAALMFFQIRREDGSIQAESSGTFVYPDGRTAHINFEDWQLEVTDTWTSPVTGATYPAGWIIRIPGLDLVLEGQPLMPNQELVVSTVYWEGAVAFEGSWQGEAVEATGYIELTGYYETMEGRL